MSSTNKNGTKTGRPKTTEIGASDVFQRDNKDKSTNGNNMAMAMLCLKTHWLQMESVRDAHSMEIL